MPRPALVLIALALATLVAGVLPPARCAEVVRADAAKRAAREAASSDSLVRALVSPVPSSFAPSVCVIPEDQDPGAVRQVLDAQVTAWNRGDLEGYMKGYWKSDSLTFYGGGDVARGWQVTYERYRRRYQSEGREMGRLAFDPLEVQMLAPGIAFVRGGWSLEMKESRPHGLFTLWLRWFPDAGWRIVHDHSSAAP
jgi:ketosteroid isomerase-like protein